MPSFKGRRLENMGGGLGDMILVFRRYGFYRQVIMFRSHFVTVGGFALFSR